METNEQKPDILDENQSFQVIRQMIQVSQMKLKNDGILFIVWGWTMFYTFLVSYLQSRLATMYMIRKILDYSAYILGILALAFTLYYIIKQHRKVQTYIGISLRYVWLSLFISLVLTNLILFNILHKVNFELQHPIFMLFIAFATVITGGILRFWLIIAGGIVFGLLAYICSYLPLQEQILIEAVAWLIAFIIPGHILYSKRKS